MIKSVNMNKSLGLDGVTYTISVSFDEKEVGNYFYLDPSYENLGDCLKELGENVCEMHKPQIDETFIVSRMEE